MCEKDNLKACGLIILILLILIGLTSCATLNHGTDEFDDIEFERCKTLEQLDCFPPEESYG